MDVAAASAGPHSEPPLSRARYQQRSATPSVTALGTWCTVGHAVPPSVEPKPRGHHFRGYRAWDKD
eukprot:11156991-Alexandrium_andersonii.AAC.1